MTNAAQTVRVAIKTPTKSRGRKGWVKVVSAVNAADNTANAFAGSVARDGWLDLPMGTVVLVADHAGTNSTRPEWIDVHVVGAEGLADPVHVCKDINGPDFFGLRDKVAELLAVRDAGAESAALAAARAAVAKLSPADLAKLLADLAK